MMSRLFNPARRGFTSLELMLAMSITIMIGAAIAGMLSVVTYGANSQRDSRTVMVRASAAQVRVGAYIAPAEDVLLSSGGDLVLWFQDFRAGGTVHATEIRWILFDAAAGTLDVHYVDFPPGWTDVAKDLADTGYMLGSDWMTARSIYETNGWLSTITLVDGLTSVAVTADAAGLITYDLEFATSNGISSVSVSATIREVNRPVL